MQIFFVGLQAVAPVYQDNKMVVILTGESLIYVSPHIKGCFQVEDPEVQSFLSEVFEHAPRLTVPGFQVPDPIVV